jgi:anaerobic magnesium-protoporphyrin IX monomethyl ester cyclase
MRALLVIPPVPYLIDDRVFPHLGILYVAAVLEREGHTVKVLDMAGATGKGWAPQLWSAIKDGYDFLGVTCTTPDFPQALQIREAAGEEDPALPVVIGGPHATVATQMCSDFDYVCTGDGETSVLELVARLKSPDCKSLSSAENPVERRVVSGDIVQDLDALPLPARHLIDMDSYHYTIDGRRATSVMTQRGCPYGCAFCCGRDLPHYRRVRTRSPTSVAMELDTLNARYGFSAFQFYDDELNLSKSRTLELMAALEGDYIYRGFIRTNLFDEDVAKAMAEAGFVEVCAGVESGSDRILKIIGKGAKVEDATRARAMAKKYGMRFKAFTIVGLPGETLEDVMATKSWLLENKPDSFDVTLNTPFPGSPEYDHRERYDIEFSVDYSKDVAFYKGVPGNYSSFVRTSALSFEDFRRLRDEIEADVRVELGMETVLQEQQRLTAALFPLR